MLKDVVKSECNLLLIKAFFGIFLNGGEVPGGLAKHRITQPWVGAGGCAGNADFPCPFPPTPRGIQVPKRAGQARREGSFPPLLFMQFCTFVNKSFLCSPRAGRGEVGGVFCPHCSAHVIQVVADRVENKA